MALVLNEEQTMLRDAAKDFLNGRAPLSHLRQLRNDDVAKGYSSEVWAEMAEMGWAAIIIPEIYGGLDYGYTGLGLILEETGRTLTPSPLLSTALLCTSALILSENEDICAQWLPQIATGEKLLALAFEESTQHRPETVNCSAEAKDDGYVLNGKKIAVMDGNIADAFIVSVRTRRGENLSEGISLFLVASDAPGVSIHTTGLLDNQPKQRNPPGRRNGKPHSTTWPPA